MNYFINIETSTDTCSVSLSNDSEVIDSRENQSRNHASTLGLFIQELLESNNLKVKDLSGVAVSKGPGSYTGLRIGTSTAKGMAYQAGIKLLAIDTLQAMALKATKPVRQCVAEIITAESYAETLAKTQMFFVGNGAEKISKIIQNPNAIFLPEIKPSAVYMAELTAKAFKDNDFADVAYFEPFYLKDYVATVSKKNVLKTTV